MRLLSSHGIQPLPASKTLLEGIYKLPLLSMYVIQSGHMPGNRFYFSKTTLVNDARLLLFPFLMHS